MLGKVPSVLGRNSFGQNNSQLLVAVDPIGGRWFTYVCEACCYAQVPKSWSAVYSTFEKTYSSYSIYARILRVSGLLHGASIFCLRIMPAFITTDLYSECVFWI